MFSLGFASSDPPTNDTWWQHLDNQCCKQPTSRCLALNCQTHQRIKTTTLTTRHCAYKVVRPNTHPKPGLRARVNAKQRHQVTEPPPIGRQVQNGQRHCSRQVRFASSYSTSSRDPTHASSSIPQHFRTPLATTLWRPATRTFEELVQQLQAVSAPELAPTVKDWRRWYFQLGMPGMVGAPRRSQRP